MKPTRARIKAQMKKVNNLAIKFSHESTKFNHMCEEYYGDETYNDHDLQSNHRLP